MSFRVAVEDGRFARTLEVRAGGVTVGSAEDCDVRLEAEGVARRHARLRQCGVRVVVEDLGGPGVTVRGRSLRRAVLGPGDAVRIGRAALRVVEVLPDPSAEVVRGAARGGSRRSGGPLAVAASLVVHATTLVLLSSVFLAETAAPPDPAHVAVAATAPDVALVEAEEEPPPLDVADLLRREEPPPEVPRVPPEPEERPAVEEEFVPPPPVRTDVPPVAPLRAAPRVPPLREVVGIGGTETPTANAGRSFGKHEAAGANAAAAAMVGESAGGAAALGAVRRAAATSNVWVLRGAYDQAEKVLRALEIAHDEIEDGGLETRAIPSSVRVLIVNCSGRAVTAETQRRIAEWVDAGGHLLTTDWALERVLERGFPGTLARLQRGERDVVTKDETVAVRVLTGRGLAEGVAGDGGATRWWLEDSSVPFTITAGLPAEILVRSDDLDRRYGPEAAAVAVTFPYGRGRVLHMLGHVFQQEGNLRGAAMTHRLVVNYLALALR